MPRDDDDRHSGTNRCDYFYPLTTILDIDTSTTCNNVFVVTRFINQDGSFTGL